MDAFTRDHLRAWAERTALDQDEADALVERIAAFVGEHPDLLDPPGRSWPEIRDLAERVL